MKDRGTERDEGNRGSIGVCARAVSEHETVTMVRLGTYYSDYGAIGSTLLQSVRFDPGIDAHERVGDSIKNALRYNLSFILFLNFSFQFGARPTIHCGFFYYILHFIAVQPAWEKRKSGAVPSSGIANRNITTCIYENAKVIA